MGEGKVIEIVKDDQSYLQQQSYQVFIPIKKDELDHSLGLELKRFYLIIKRIKIHKL